MIGSIKLLIAALGVSHSSGVMGAQGNEKRREHLRRSLRKGIAHSNAEMESERKMQFIAFASEDGNPVANPDPGYDDYFGPPEPMLKAVDQQDENFFEETSSGMAYNWENAASHGHGHTHDDGHTVEDHVPPRSGKSGKSWNVGDNIQKDARLEKAAKVGKMMWDETPIMVKGGKSDKKFKDVKSLKAQISFKGAKGSFATNTQRTSYYDSRVEDHVEDHGHDHDHDHVDHTHDSEDGLLSGFSSSGLGYGDLFQKTATVHQSDDFFAEGRANIPTQVEMGQVKEKQNAVQTRAAIPSVSGRHENTFDDDFFNADERLVFRPRPVVTLASSVFSVTPGTLVSPVVPDGTGDTQNIGTEYLFNEVMTDSQNINSQLAPVDVDGETVLFIVSLDGYCTRIGPADQNSVQGYCFLTYTFIDPSTQLTSGSVTAQGIIVNASVPGQLTITGGTGTMTGATGLVEILPASVNNDMNPPELVAPIAGSDPFNAVAGWAHFFEFDVDVLFFLPELYAR